MIIESPMLSVLASLQPVKKHLSKLAAGLSCHGIQLRILLTRTVSASVKSASTRKLAQMGILVALWEWYLLAR